MTNLNNNDDGDNNDNNITFTKYFWVFIMCQALL